MKLLISGYAEFAASELGIRERFTSEINQSVSEKRRREMALTNYLVERMFGSRARLLHDSDGAPCVEGYSGTVSVTHSLGYVAVACDDSRRIGIDIESPRETLRRVARRFLSEAELPVYSRDLGLLLRAWTAKEAVYKAAGVKLLGSHDIVLPSDPLSPLVTAAGRCFAVTYHPIGDELMAVATEVEKR